MSNGGITINEYSKLLPDVTRRTLQRDLKSLVEKGIINTSGATNNHIYRFT